MMSYSFCPHYTGVNNLCSPFQANSDFMGGRDVHPLEEVQIQLNGASEKSMGCIHGRLHTIISVQISVQQ